MIIVNGEKLPYQAVCVEAFEKMDQVATDMQEKLICTDASVYFKVHIARTLMLSAQESILIFQFRLV